MKKTIGILGGMGPLATADLFRKIIDNTQAGCDQDHLRVVIDSNTNIPDRTAAILHGGEDPVREMVRSGLALEGMGADLLIMPCNTAHYFYDRLQRSLPVPVLNMIQLTVRTAKAGGCQKLGILATSGTVASCSYQRMCAAEGIGCAVPDEADQATLMNTIIYGQIKSGKPVDLELFGRIADGLKAKGCQKAVLGCTELSLIKRDYGLDDFFIDSTEVLAKATIEACGKTPVGFDF